MITFAASPVPSWYLSQVSEMGPRLPVSSALHPVLVAAGRKYPYWLTAAVTGDIVRPVATGLGHGGQAQPPEVASMAADLGLTCTAFGPGGAGALGAFRAGTQESIGNTLAGLVWWRDEDEGWWYPLIGHDRDCRHILIRTWGQKHHEFRRIDLDSIASGPDFQACLVRGPTPSQPLPDLARKALCRAVDVALPAATDSGRMNLFEGYERLAEGLSGLSEAEAADPGTARMVASNVACLCNAKHAAYEFCAQSQVWLPAWATFLEGAGLYYGKLTALLNPASAEFGDLDSARRLLARPEKRIALAQTLRAAARVESRAIERMAAAVGLGVGTP